MDDAHVASISKEFILTTANEYFYVLYLDAGEVSRQEWTLVRMSSGGEAQPPQKKGCCSSVNDELIKQAVAGKGRLLHQRPLLLCFTYFILH